MIDFYEVIKASEGIAVADEFAALWGRKISGGYVISTYTGVLPATLQTVAGYLASYKIYGNTVQDGTPTPENPIVPSGCGVKVDITGLSEPLCGIGEYTDSLDLSTGTLTRRIGKLVLDGTGGKSTSTGRYTFYITNPLKGIAPICTHYVGSTVTYYAGLLNDHVSVSIQSFMTIYDDRLMTIDKYNEFYAAQYTAGTPVTIWYVLAEPEISTIPVPSGLTGTIEGYLIQNDTPTPENPIYPTANGVKQADDTYSIPYGYKLPLTVNGVEYPIYLGDNQLAKDEYVDSETGQIYRYVDGTLTPTDPTAPLPQIPTAAGETIISYGDTGAQPEKVEMKYRR